MRQVFLVFADGGARGNPGPAAAGVVIKDEKKKIVFKQAKYLGYKTNNEAEYEAVLLALLWLKENRRAIKEIHFYLDSQLLVNQLAGRWRIKADNLKPLAAQAKEKIAVLSVPTRFFYLPREENALADRLVNLTLDKAAEKK